MSDIADRLVRAGLSAPAAASKSELFDVLSDAFVPSSTGAADPLRFFVPGRIEFLGKHTDYAGGRSLICAIERGICVVASPRADSTVRIIDANRKSDVEFAIQPELEPASGGWTNYPMTVARRLARNFSGSGELLRGADIVFASDLPPSSGLSSSSVLIVGVFSALAEINQLQRRAEYADNIRSLEDLAGYLGAVENGQSFGSLTGDRGVGTFGGSQDHTAILCCRVGQLSQYLFRPVRHERSIAIGDDYVFVVGVSGVAARKTGEARENYNDASLKASAVIDVWREASARAEDTLLDAVMNSADAPDRIRQLLRESSHSRFSPGELLDRFEQFFAECTDIIPRVGDSMVRGTLEAIGEPIDRSQQLAERLLGNQVPETKWLAHSARDLGALAASAFGAGFGGSVWALVTADRVEEFMSDWSKKYRGEFPASAERSHFFSTRPGPGLVRL